MQNNKINVNTIKILFFNKQVKWIRNNYNNELEIHFIKNIRYL